MAGVKSLPSDPLTQFKKYQLREALKQKSKRQFEGAHTEESCENLYFFMKSVPEVTKNIHEFF